MDAGQYRGQRPVERRASNTPQAAYNPVEPAQAEKVTPIPPSATTRRSEPSTPPKKKRSWIVIAIAAVVVLGLAAGWFAWSNMQRSITGIETGKYQAVFFTNGQVYFGKLQQIGNDSMKLTDVFYLQGQQADSAENSKNPQTTDSSSNVQLIKLGDEVHGPEDAMIIGKTQVLFIENLKTDGKVAQSIAKYKESN